MNDQPQPQPGDEQESSPSPATLFLEMMRQAVRDTEPEAEDEPAPAEEPPVMDSVSETTTPPEIASSTPPTSPTSRVPIYTAPDELAADEDSRMEEQRVRRLQRRQERRRRHRTGAIGGFIRTMLLAVIAAALSSTIFTWFTEPDFLNPGVAVGLQVADATSVAAAAPPTTTAIAVTPNWMQRIGIVSGHRGPENDPGAVCPDGLTEAEINFAVAQLVVQELRVQGYTVDLLDEFDPRLNNYQAAALVSIHANDCRDYGEFVSGYLVARAAARPAGGFDDVLAECIALHYYNQTQLDRRFSLTLDMTDYHTFREIHPLTPAAILELGFMKDDRELLTQQQDVLARGIVDGILCYLRGDNPTQIMTEQAPTQAAQ